MTIEKFLQWNLYNYKQHNIIKVKIPKNQLHVPINAKNKTRISFFPFILLFLLRSKVLNFEGCPLSIVIISFCSLGEHKNE